MDEDDAAQAGARRQKLMHLTRDDLGQVPPAKARELLTKYEPLIQGFVRRFPARLLGAQFDEEDLRSLGQVMLLQMWLLYDPEQGSFHGWATFLFRQSFGKILRDLQANREITTDLLVAPGSPAHGEGRSLGLIGLVGYIVGNHDAWLRDNTATELELDEELDARREVEQLERALEQMTPRHRFVLQGIREGRTTEQIALDLGVSRQRVDQIREVAMEALRHEIWRPTGGSSQADEPAATLTPWRSTKSASASSPS
jgi:RNA polymerase sigma factor (sigma-70 family)